MWGGPVPGLRDEACIALAHAAVGDQRVDAARGERAEVRLAVVARIRREERGGVEVRRQRVDHRQQHLLFGARAVRLRFDDDLVRAVDGRHRCVALDHALARGQLRALRVGPVPLPRATGRPLPILGVRGEPGTELRGIALQPFDTVRCLRGHVRLDEGDERHVLAAEPLDPAAAHDAVGVRAQHYGEQHRRRVRGGAGGVLRKRASKRERSTASCSRWCAACSKVPGRSCAARSTGRKRGLVSMYL
jgi:hypothetical protein